MSCVFQNIDPPPSSPPSAWVTPAFVAGGGHTRRVERGVGGQYFGRSKTPLCTLPILNPLWIYLTVSGGNESVMSCITASGSKSHQLLAA
jgi:hypothetical protein